MTKLKEKERYPWVMEDSSRILTNAREFFNPGNAWKKVAGIKKEDMKPQKSLIN